MQEHDEPRRAPTIGAEVDGLAGSAHPGTRSPWTSRAASRLPHDGRGAHRAPRPRPISCSAKRGQQVAAHVDERQEARVPQQPDHGEAVLEQEHERREDDPGESDPAGEYDCGGRRRRSAATVTPIERREHDPRRRTAAGRRTSPSTSRTTRVAGLGPRTSCRSCRSGSRRTAPSRRTTAAPAVPAVVMKYRTRCLSM